MVPKEPVQVDKTGRGNVFNLLLRNHVQDQHSEAAPQTVNTAASPHSHSPHPNLGLFFFLMNAVKVNYYFYHSATEFFIPIGQ